MGGPGKNLRMVSLGVFKPLISKHIKNLFRGFYKTIFKCSRINKLGNLVFLLQAFLARAPHLYILVLDSQTIH